jgi:hypothetical protein
MTEQYGWRNHRYSVCTITISGRQYRRRYWTGDDGKPHSEYEHRARWLDAGGEIPPGWRLYFLDGDRLNCKPTNLLCAHPSVTGRLQRGKAGRKATCVNCQRRRPGLEDGLCYRCRRHRTLHGHLPRQPQADKGICSRCGKKPAVCKGKCRSCYVYTQFVAGHPTNPLYHKRTGTCPNCGNGTFQDQQYCRVCRLALKIKGRLPRALRFRNLGMCVDCQTKPAKVAERCRSCYQKQYRAGRKTCQPTCA